MPGLAGYQSQGAPPLCGNLAAAGSAARGLAGRRRGARLQRADADAQSALGPFAAPSRRSCDGAECVARRTGDEPGRPHPAPGRDGHREGYVRARDPPERRSPRQAVRRGELRGDSGKSDRERAVRLRRRRLHRRPCRWHAGQGGGGARRHLVPGRDRRHAASPASSPVAPAGGKGGDAARQQPRHRRGCTRDQRDEPGSWGDGGGW